MRADELVEAAEGMCGVKSCQTAKHGRGKEKSQAAR